MDEVSRILQFLQVTFPAETEGLEPDTPLLETVLFDSLAYLEIAMFLEQEFDLTLSRGDMEPANFQTALSLAALVRSKTRR